MTDQEILKKLNIEAADETLNQSILKQFHQVVEMRLMNLVGAMVEGDAAESMRKMEAEGKPAAEIVEWLCANVADVNEMRKALTEDYLQEMQQRIG